MNIFSKFFSKKKEIDPASISIPVQETNASISQRERRAKSETFCIQNKIPVYQNPNALFAEYDENVELRTVDKIVDRAIALCYIELKSESAEIKAMKQFEAKYNVMQKLTFLEKEFAFNDNPTPQEMANANWRAESFQLLLWSLGYTELSYPGDICNIGDAVTILFSRSEEAFRLDAQLRTKAEILDKLDQTLRFHWACVSARVKGENMPGGLNASIVYERHYALNWLINNNGEEWDEITCHT